MVRVAARDHAAADAFRAMQGLTQRLWSLDGRHHIGGLAWQRYEHTGREAAWPTRLWRDRGETVAWAWIYERDPDLLYLEVDPAFRDLTPAVLDWFEATATSQDLVVEITDRQADLIAMLRGRGYERRADGPFGLLTLRELTDLPALGTPDGFSMLSMADVHDPDRRAAAHRAAWTRIAGREGGPAGLSSVTGESYRRVMAAWPYRPELDLMVEAENGKWAATCCAWLDADNAVGELEPVGTDADFRRGGLGRTVCLAALHALAKAGAKRAIVGARGDDAYPVPRRLYFGLGFRTYARTEAFVKPRPA